MFNRYFLSFQEIHFFSPACKMLLMPRNDAIYMEMFHPFKLTLTVNAVSPHSVSCNLGTWQSLWNKQFIILAPLHPQSNSKLMSETRKQNEKQIRLT